MAVQCVTLAHKRKRYDSMAKRSPKTKMSCSNAPWCIVSIFFLSGCYGCFCLPLLMLWQMRINAAMRSRPPLYSLWFAHSFPCKGARCDVLFFRSCHLQCGADYNFLVVPWKLLLFSRHLVSYPPIISKQHLRRMVFLPSGWISKLYIYSTTWWKYTETAILYGNFNIYLFCAITFHFLSINSTILGKSPSSVLSFFVLSCMTFPQS